MRHVGRKDCTEYGYAGASTAYIYERFVLVLLCLGVGLVVSTLFPVALYRDATFVRHGVTTWEPNPATYLVPALLSVFLLSLTAPFVGGYYLYRRRRAFRDDGKSRRRAR